MTLVTVRIRSVQLRPTRSLSNNLSDLHVTFDPSDHISRLSLSACVLLILQVSLMSHSSKTKSRALPHFLQKLFLFLFHFSSFFVFF